CAPSYAYALFFAFFRTPFASRNSLRARRICSAYGIPSRTRNASISAVNSASSLKLTCSESGFSLFGRGVMFLCCLYYKNYHKTVRQSTRHCASSSGDTWNRTRQGCRRPFCRCCRRRYQHARRGLQIGAHCLRMAPAMPADDSVDQKLALDTQLVDGYLSGLQSEIAAKLRRVAKFRAEMRKLDATRGPTDRASRRRAARALIQQ